MYNYSSST